MNLSSAPPFFSFHPHPRYPSQRCSSSTGKLCKYHPFSPHISGHFATNLRYVECEKRVFLDYATLLRFVEVDIRWAAYSFNAFCVHTPVNIKIRISICSLSIQRSCQIQFFFCKVFFNIIILCVSEWYFTSS